MSKTNLMLTIDELRKLAFSFPEVSEAAHFEKTAFKVKKKIFATYDAVNNRVCLKFSDIDQSAFCAADSIHIFPVANIWGKQGWTLIDLTEVHPDLLADALSTAYCTVAPKRLADQLKKLS